MSISRELLLAILSMDSYNRGYEPGITGLGGEGSGIGTAIVTKDAEQLLGAGTAEAAGFYAVAYAIDGEIVISYRGTDSLIVENIATNYPIAHDNDFTEPSVHLAVQFYNAVKAANPGTTITLTGHSLGGALAGFVGSLYGDAKTLTNGFAA